MRELNQVEIENISGGIFWITPPTFGESLVTSVFNFIDSQLSQLNQFFESIPQNLQQNFAGEKGAVPPIFIIKAGGGALPA